MDEGRVARQVSVEPLADQIREVVPPGLQAISEARRSLGQAKSGVLQPGRPHSSLGWQYADQACIASQSSSRRRITSAESLIDSSQRSNQPSHVVAYGTIGRNSNIFRKKKITEALKDDDSKSTETHQERALNLLLKFGKQEDNAASFVLTGSIGVGKSTILRMFATRLSIDYLESPREDVELPIFVPLQQFTLAPKLLDSILELQGKEAGKKLFDAVISKWIVWVNDNTFSNATDECWLYKRLQKQPSVFIFDSVDEFTMNHPMLGLSSFRDLRQYLLEEFGRNQKLRLVFGVRNSWPGRKELATRSENVVEIGRLSKNQIAKYYKSAIHIIDSIPESVRTPERFQNHEKWTEEIDFFRPISIHHTRTKISQINIMTIIESSGFPDLEIKPGVKANTDEWINALSLVAWIFFRDFQGQMSCEDIQSKAEKVIEDWRKTLRHKEENNKASNSVLGFEILLSEQFELLLKRSVFIPANLVGNQTVRFDHQEDLDYLVSRYLAWCIEFEHVDELRYRGFTTKHFRIASVILEDKQIKIEYPIVKKIVERTKELQSRFILGNFAGLLANLRSGMDGPAIDYLFSTFESHEIDKTAKHVFTAGMGYRVLSNETHDPARESIKHRLISYLQNLAKAPEKLGASRVTASVAWCYLKTFSDHNGSDKGCDPDFPWPGLGEEDEALSMVWASSGSREIDEKHRSLQIAFLEVQGEIQESPARLISIMHYLYLIVVAWKRQRHISEIDAELPNLLGEDSLIKKNLQESSLSIEELRKIFKCCQRIYDQPDLLTHEVVPKN